MPIKQWISILLFIVLASLTLYLGEVEAGEVKEATVEIEETVAEVKEALNETEFAFDKMEQYFTTAAGIVEKYGGDVAELGLMALRLDAASVILSPLTFLLIFIFVNIRISPHIAQRIAAFKDPSDRLPSTIIHKGIIYSGITLCTLEVMNMWAWAGIFYPELYAVHKFIIN